MKETRYYKIAGQVISVTGDLSPLIEKVGGFDVFETSSQPFILDVHIDQTFPEKFEGYCFYTMDTEQLSIQFKCQKYGYGILMKDKSTSVPLLSVKYNTENKYCYLNGLPDVNTIRLALWFVFGWAVIEDQTIAIHASSIVYRNKAVLFLGESGVGKSTHSRLWLENIKDVTLLNDDSPVLQVKERKTFAYGSPWSGKTPCFCSMVKEVAAIIRLSQFHDNTIQSLNIHEAIGAIYPSLPPSIVQNFCFERFVYHILSGILSHIPVYSLKCQSNEKAALLAFHSVFGSK
jgi:hypothetical protein